ETAATILTRRPFTTSPLSVGLLPALCYVRFPLIRAAPAGLSALEATFGDYKRATPAPQRTRRQLQLIPLWEGSSSVLTRSISPCSISERSAAPPQRARDRRPTRGRRPRPGRPPACEAGCSGCTARRGRASG